MNLLELQIPNLERVLGSRQGGNKTCVQGVTVHTHSCVVQFYMQVLHLKQFLHRVIFRSDLEVVELSHAQSLLGVGFGVVPILHQLSTFPGGRTAVKSRFVHIGL